ncbi:MAG TPA: hypothetical protein VJ521_11335, partial [Acidobacteriota bacterium]|nr:hypothetical protein [Acidobacteriota bacterium]
MQVASTIPDPAAHYHKRLAAVLFASFSLQIAIASLPSVGDSQIYRLWIRALANEGLAAAYWDKPIASATGMESYYYVDYPPVYPYLLYAE